METWGLPITEFKEFNKPMFVAEMRYARETVGNYKNVNFFTPENGAQLSGLMANAITGTPTLYDETSAIYYEEPFVNSWNELFSFLFTTLE